MRWNVKGHQMSPVARVEERIRTSTLASSLGASYIDTIRVEQRKRSRKGTAHTGADSSTLGASAAGATSEVGAAVSVGFTSVTAGTTGAAGAISGADIIAEK